MFNNFFKWLRNKYLYLKYTKLRNNNYSEYKRIKYF